MPARAGTRHAARNGPSPPRLSRPTQPDNVLGADVGGEDRRADDPPAEVAAGQEVVGGSVLGSAHDPPGHAQQYPEVEGNRQPVEAGQRWAAGGGQWGSIHRIHYAISVFRPPDAGS